MIALITKKAAQPVDPCGDACSTDSSAGVGAHGPTVRKVLWLSSLSLVWMTAEGGLGLYAGLSAYSLSLIGWALGSVIEGLASAIVIWRFTGTRLLSGTSERRAQQAVALSFWLLAPYIAVEAVRDLLGGSHVQTSVLGIAVTASSLLIMPALGIAKTRLARHLDSDATAGEERRTCSAPHRPLPSSSGSASTPPPASTGWTPSSPLPLPRGRSAKGWRHGAAKSAADDRPERVAPHILRAARTERGLLAAGGRRVCAKLRRHTKSNAARMASWSSSSCASRSHPHCSCSCSIGMLTIWSHFTAPS